MTPEDVVDWIVKIVVALGGLGGITAFFMVRAQKRKLIADTGKTDAEADSVMADAQSKRTAREISMIEPYERIQARMSLEIEELYDKVDRLQAWAEMMADALRKNGLPIPDMPPRKEPQHRSARVAPRQRD